MYRAFYKVCFNNNNNNDDNELAVFVKVLHYKISSDQSRSKVEQFAEVLLSFQMKKKLQ